jgi:hypothetical protein
MEKLMFKYLNESNPCAYIYRCKFGDALYDNQIGDFAHSIYRGTILKQLMSLFCCDESYANNVYNNWRASLPVYVRVMNATNEHVIIPLETECNTTV